jgi:nitroimidazol reductase NimA-like FMN-containing flavoprotein (pyridoxamine 5'-phosphate oxidase superfamily)
MVDMVTVVVHWSWISINWLSINEELGMPGDTEYLKSDKNTANVAVPRVFRDKEPIQAILRQGYLCHVGFSVHDAAGVAYPTVVPLLYVFKGESIYLHCSAKSRLYKAALAAKEGLPVCATVSLVSAFYLAEKPYWHDLDYRSVMVHGLARPVTQQDPLSKKGKEQEALAAVLDGVIPGRTGEGFTDYSTDEKHPVGTLGIDLSAATSAVSGKDSAKPLDTKTRIRDLTVDSLWTGKIPIHETYGDPVPDPKNKAAVPDYVKKYQRPTK